MVRDKCMCEWDKSSANWNIYPRLVPILCNDWMILCVCVTLSLSFFLSPRTLGMSCVHRYTWVTCVCIWVREKRLKEKRWEERKPELACSFIASRSYTHTQTLAHTAVLMMGIFHSLLFSTYSLWMSHSFFYLPCHPVCQRKCVCVCVCMRK